MGTAQTTRNPDSITLNYANYASTIATLQTNMASGKKIYSSDITTLKALINGVMGHYHNYTDAYQLATYGAGYGDNPSAGDRTNYYTSGGVNTSAMVGNAGSTTVLTFTASAGTPISYTHHNAFRNGVLALSDHYHPISDRYSA